MNKTDRMLEQVKEDLLPRLSSRLLGWNYDWRRLDTDEGIVVWPQGCGLCRGDKRAMFEIIIRRCSETVGTSEGK